VLKATNHCFSLIPNDLAPISSKSVWVVSCKLLLLLRFGELFCSDGEDDHEVVTSLTEKTSSAPISIEDARATLEATNGTDDSKRVEYRTASSHS